MRKKERKSQGRKVQKSCRRAYLFVPYQPDTAFVGRLVSTSAELFQSCLKNFGSWKGKEGRRKEKKKREKKRRKMVYFFYLRVEERKRKENGVLLL